MSNLSIDNEWRSANSVVVGAVPDGPSIIDVGSLLESPIGISLFPVTTAVFSLIILFVVAKGVYAVFLSPLSRFPGPNIAAITKLFEAYHVLVKNDWYETLEELHGRHGPIVRIGPNELHFVDHEFCLRHHKRADLNKCDNYYGLLNKLMGGLASPHRHSERKSQIQGFFNGQTLATYSSFTLSDQVERLHDRLLNSASKDTEINITHYFWAYTNDIMMSYLFGKDPKYLQQPDLVKVHDDLRAFSAIDLATVLRTMPPVKKMLDIFPTLRRFSPLGWLDKLVETQLDPLLKGDRAGELSKDRRTVLAEVWGQLRNEELVVQEMAQAIFIGNESLLSNLTFLLHYMIQNPACIAKLRAELDTLNIGLYGYRVWRDPKVMRLGYLDALCRESHRLSSPGWHRQPRQIAEPIDYNGHIIPPMTSLSFTLRMLEHDPALYPEPDSFKPDRWLGFTEEAKRNRTNAVTFGTGTRTCLGQFIARHVLRKTLACLIYNFDVSLWDEEADKLSGYRYLDTYPKKGHEGFLKIRLTPRFSSASSQWKINAFR